MTEQVKEAMIDWLKQQGVPTVLLCAILGFIGYAVVVIAPEHIKMINAGYERVTQQHQETITKMVDSHDKDRQMFVDLLNGRQLTHKP